ncbi:hypothetical protein [Amycolatopsis sp. NPDC051371]|uniref:hypothetical protein n=1 Tax=Amycolatopsis sp. NPDC051371 TaxID=3155800 RepID=UPI00342C147A
MYQLLADHPGADTTAAPLAAALDLPETDISAALQQLHATHLVQRRPGDRYRLADRVRTHASHLRGQEPPSARTRQHARLIDFYAASAAAAVLLVAPEAHRFSPPVAHDTLALRHADQRRARAWFGWEHHVLRTVAATALGWGWDDVVVELAEAVWHLARPGYHHDDLVHIQYAGHTAAARSHPGIAPVFQARAAAGLSDLGRHDDAFAAATHTAAHAHDLGDAHLLALTQSVSGRVQLAAGRADDAFQALGNALRPQRRLIDDQFGHAVLHRRIGQAYLALGHPQQALLHLRDSREEMTRAGHPLGAARAATWLAEALVATGRAGPAFAELSQARELIGDTVAVRYRAQLDLTAARAAFHLGDIGITRRLTDTLITQLTHAGPGAAADLHAATELRNQL